MALTTEELQKVHRGFMRYVSSNRTSTGSVAKGDLYDAIVATDNWIEDNQASYNSALPNPVRSQFGLALKTLLFCVVAMARVSIPFLRRIFSVD